MAAAGITVQGDKELIAKLQNLSKKGAKAALRKGTRVGATMILKAARAAAPVGPTGNYKKGIKLKPRQKANVVSTWVRATAPHSSLLEFGTKDRHTKAGKYTGRGPALHVMKKVADATGQRALDTTVKHVAVLIEQAAKGDGSGS